MSEAESVEPAVVMEIGNHKDPNTETPNQDASAAKSDVAEQGENKEVSQENQNKGTAKEEKRKQKAERRQNRDFFAFIRKGEESSDDEPLEGEELERELALHRKMRDQVMQEVKKHREAPFVRQFMNDFGTEMTDEDFERSELEIYAAFLPHPYPL